jgi:hypothetical protein
VLTDAVLQGSQEVDELYHKLEMKRRELEEAQRQLLQEVASLNNLDELDALTCCAASNWHRLPDLVVASRGRKLRPLLDKMCRC